MDDKKVIIVLLIVIAVILACIIGFVLMPSSNAQKDSKVEITSNSTLYEGDNLTVKLADLNGTAIQKERVNVTVTDNNGNVVSKKGLLTDSKGEASAELELDAGKYSVNVTFAGNGNFTSNSTAQDLEILEVVAESEEPQPVEESSAPSNEIHYDAEINVYYDDNGVVVDPDGEHGMDVGRQYSELVERREKWERGELVM